MSHLKIIIAIDGYSKIIPEYNALAISIGYALCSRLMCCNIMGLSDGTFYG